MGFYDQAYKNIGKQASYAAATVGAYLFHNYRKDKAQAAKQNVKEEVEAKDISVRAVAELSMLEPFGEANKMPLFLYKNLKINSILSV